MARHTAVVRCLVLLATAALATAVGRDDWQVTGVPTPRLLLELTIGLHHPEGALQALKDSCMAVSDPDSDSYSQYLTREEVAVMTASEKHLSTVTNFLTTAGASRLSVVPTRDALTASMTVAQVEAAFGVTLSVYTHVEQPMRMVRSATAPQLPREVEEAIAVLVGVSDFPTLPRPSTHSRARKQALNTAASMPPATPGDGPIAPILGLMYVSDTTATLMTIQMCPGPFGNQRSTTKLPCANSADPITGYEAHVYVDGKLVHDALPVPLSMVTPEIQPSPTANSTVYNVELPLTLTVFQSVNASLRAVSKSGKSAFTQLPWKNQYSFTNADRRMVATPYVTPEFLNTFYNLPAMPTPPAAATQSVAEFGGQYYSPVDLANFFKKYNLAPTKVVLHGPNDGPQSGGEATLDIQWITAVAPGVETTFWSVAPAPPVSDSFLFRHASELNAATNPPLVSSISYGLGEDQMVSSGLGDHYIARTNAEYLKLCSRGIGIVVAAGDAGASNDGHGSNSCAVQPDFPSSSPWVTTVSASFVTNLGQPRPGSTMGEQAISIPNGMFWSTGGGFSSNPSCEQPWYQRDAVQAYLKTGAGTFPPSSMFNSSLRAYPDVSAIGHNLMCEWAGTLVPTDGTSASSPIFAAIISRLNAARLAAGKKQLGFANPVLYKLAASNPTVFHDITIGNNRCAGFTCCPQGYVAEEGFDAVSGLGSLGDYAELESLVLAL